MPQPSSRASWPKAPPRAEVASGRLWRWPLWAALSLALVGGLRQCPGRAGMLVPETLRESAVTGPQETRKLVDPLGREFDWRKPPARIVSLVLGADEILVELLPPERLFGCTVFVDDPYSSVLAGHYPPTIPRVASEIERILAARPDLVIVAGYTSAEFVLNLLDIGVPTLRIARYHRLEDVTHLIDLLGRATGEELRADRLRARFTGRLEAVRAAVAGRPTPRVLVFQQGGYSVGQGTMIDELIERAGGLNVVRSLGVVGHVRLGDEAVLLSDPDFVVVTVAKVGEPADVATLLPASLLGLRAVREGNVVRLPAAWLTSVSHHVAEGLEGMARVFHPEAFADPKSKTADPEGGRHTEGARGAR